MTTHTDHISFEQYQLNTGEHYVSYTHDHPRGRHRLVVRDHGSIIYNPPLDDNHIVAHNWEPTQNNTPNIARWDHITNFFGGCYGPKPRRETLVQR